MSRLAETILDKVSIEYIRNQVLKNAYGNDDTPIANLDPRVLLLWYCFFGIVPWFVNDVVFLLSIFAFVVVTTKLARIAPLVIFVFIVGVFSQTGYLLIVSLFFGGNLTTLMPILVMTLKVAVVSLASITVFSGLDPDKLVNGLLWFKCPSELSFSISFGYRILPLLMETYQNILMSYKLRGRVPEHKNTVGKIKYLIYQVKIIMLSFYPLMLSTAKRSRTTVEALELKGYRYAMMNPKVKKLKLASLKITGGDILFIWLSVAWVLISVLITRII